MMRMDQPTVQFEAGADCDPTTRNLWLARGQAQNLLYADVLLANERLEPFDYGAWWFYAFPLTSTDDYPPPLFVRGDDAYWGLRHTPGKSIAMNGIGVWHADFDHKNGPTSAFYENRNVPDHHRPGLPGSHRGRAAAASRRLRDCGRSSRSATTGRRPSSTASRRSSTARRR